VISCKVGEILSTFLTVFIRVYSPAVDHYVENFGKFFQSKSIHYQERRRKATNGGSTSKPTK